MARLVSYSIIIITLHLFYITNVLPFYRDKCVSTDRTASERPSRHQRTPQSANARRRHRVHLVPGSHSSSRSCTMRPRLRICSQYCSRCQNCICPTSRLRRLSRPPCRQAEAEAAAAHHHQGPRRPPCLAEVAR